MISVTYMKDMKYSVTKKVVGKLKMETLRNFRIDKFICSRSKAYSFECGDGNKN